MASVLHRVTKEYLPYVNTPDYPGEDWIHNPDLSKVKGFPRKYWIIEGSQVSLAERTARNIIDRYEEESAKTQIAAELDHATPEVVRWTLLLDEINQLRSHMNLKTRTIPQIKAMYKGAL